MLRVAAEGVGVQGDGLCESGRDALAIVVKWSGEENTVGLAPDASAASPRRRVTAPAARGELGPGPTCGGRSGSGGAMPWL